MGFEPYVIDMGVQNFRFFVATPEGEDWYNPIKPYTKLEYEWVLDNVDLKHKQVLDCGGHHGHYAMVLGREGILKIVEPYHDNIAIIRQNMELNAIAYDIFEGVVSSINGQRGFKNQSNGMLSLDSAHMVDSLQISQIMPGAEVVKLDIEGAEFEVLPRGLDKMPECNTWIVEIHPNKGDVNIIADGFTKRGFELLKVNREKMIVEPYQWDVWPTHATLIARRDV